ncbi:hypothetical protein [Siccibacter colletis]|uniref:Phage protein n=1 Tax=Siccibacter colletis TaxID=1505757 RepID=A0ABY6JI76_9ENTR|nr:hypothetical protein [Siccibacter colletis]UYU33470.1 hypothetical protein KFZ77_08225 [Siccibacter colletis]
MSVEDRIKQLELTVHRLTIETRVLRELMQVQVGINNINLKGHFDDVIIKLATEYQNRGLDKDDNQALHDTLRDYLRDSKSQH